MMKIDMKRTLAIMMSAGIMLVAGCSGNAISDQNGRPDAHSSAVSQQQGANAPKTSGKKDANGMMTLTVYFATRDALYLQGETTTVTANEHPAKTAVELLLKGPKSRELVNLSPANTKVRSVNIKNGIAYVDFDTNVLKNTQGGSAAESLFVAAIVDTLTEFDNIDHVQILVQGKVVASLWGHVDVSEPLSRSEKVIKK